jgi:hypothetical protein
VWQYWNTREDTMLRVRHFAKRGRRSSPASKEARCTLAAACSALTDAWAHRIGG